ncbi:hypothetical protein COO60DRAFT_97923 [Scenedesmus sp. NREL 46B-D3]|nr:hypothetical protein COO60DRAFT_97923 [Scenedesmus sp. NREL 46B-D3]
MQQGEWAAAPGPSRTHRRSRSEGAGGAVQDSASLGGFHLQGASHMRTISLDTSATNFLQSLQLHDVNALHPGMLDAAEAAVLDQQYDAAAIAAGAGRSWAAASPKFAGAAAAGDHAWQQGEGTVMSAGSKRAHCGNARVGKDSLQEGKKESLHQHKHSFTPALPAVEEAEDAAGASDGDDEDYRGSDSDRELYAVTQRGRRSHSGRGRARRGGYNGRNENELMLLDPKRVKRIMANRQSAARSKERRTSYTMQLESKLQSIHNEVDRLNAQLEGMQGQGKLLLQARRELEQQVESMQQQLGQAAADNQVLTAELFALQSALGLPQMLPQPDMSAAAVTAAAAGQPLERSAAARSTVQLAAGHCRCRRWWWVSPVLLQALVLRPVPLAAAGTEVWQQLVLVCLHCLGSMRAHPTCSPRAPAAVSM